MAKGQSNWEQLLEQLDSGSEWVFPQEGKTRVRLVKPPEREPREFFQEVTNSYGKTKYMVWGYVPGEGDARIQGVILPKTALKGAIGLLAEGYDLLSDEGAHGITITRSGSGRYNTSYNVTPSVKPQDLPEGIEWPDETMDDMAERFLRDAEQRANNRSNSPSDNGDGDEVEFDLDDDDEEEEMRARPPRRSRGGKKRTRKSASSW